MTILNVYREDKRVLIPKYATKNSACFDIHAYLPKGREVAVYTPLNDAFYEITTAYKEWITIKPKHRALIPTGLIFDIPEGYTIRLHPRSGLALREGVTLMNCEGVIDSDYVRPTFVMLVNTTEDWVRISNGDRICQGELLKVEQIKFKEIKERPKQKTDRDGGFGSTGR